MSDTHKVGSIEWAWNLIDREERPDTGEADQMGWDNLMSLGPEDIGGAYGTNKEDSYILWAVIQARTDNRRCLVAAPGEHPVVDAMLEAEHQSYDGWTTRQRLIIEAFVGDVAWAVYQTARDKEKGNV